MYPPGPSSLLYSLRTQRCWVAGSACYSDGVRLRSHHRAPVFSKPGWLGNVAGPDAVGDDGRGEGAGEGPDDGDGDGDAVLVMVHEMAAPAAGVIANEPLSRALSGRSSSWIPFASVHVIVCVLARGAPTLTLSKALSGSRVNARDQ